MEQILYVERTNKQIIKFINRETWKYIEISDKEKIGSLM